MSRISPAAGRVRGEKMRAIERRRTSGAVRTSAGRAGRAGEKSRAVIRGWLYARRSVTQARWATAPSPRVASRPPTLSLVSLFSGGNRKWSQLWRALAGKCLCVRRRERTPASASARTRSTSGPQRGREIARFLSPRAHTSSRSSSRVRSGSEHPPCTKGGVSVEKS